MDDHALGRLLRDDLAHQDGVVARHQLEASGAAPHDLKRWVRNRLLARVHPGVYVDHTGLLTDRQQVWAAVLACGPGAAHCLADRPHPPIHVAIDARRRNVPPPGVRLHRVRGLAAQVLDTASPPRLRPEHDVLLAIDLAERDEDVVRLLTDAVRSRATTAARIREVVVSRSRLRHRGLVLAVLHDAENGTHSVLEWRYLRDVERAHGLPAATWQRRRRAGGRVEYADAIYERQQVVVEIDGRAGHEGWDAENRDGRRDLDQAAEGWLPVRLRSRQVLRDSCETAGRIAMLLQSRGWTGSLRRCGDHCRTSMDVPVRPVDQDIHDRAG